MGAVTHVHCCNERVKDNRHPDHRRHVAMTDREAKNRLRRVQQQEIYQPPDQSPERPRNVPSPVDLHNPLIEALAHFLEGFDTEPIFLGPVIEKNEEKTNNERRYSHNKTTKRQSKFVQSLGIQNVVEIPH